ncbi:hypothetical protein L3073_07330 [Ancylomarina sp. DW003]|nr:hypothetical protein [Ancylomarina sp. DW003]MDE5422017.1 hypothetical protein [Ancylomarina sp. DW003]
MKKILLITHQKDNFSIEKVSHHLNELGAEVVRFNSDLYPSEISVSQSFSDNGIETIIEIDSKEYLLDEFEAIWYRRLFLGQALDTTIPKAYRDPILEESRRVIYGIMETTDVFKLDDYRTVRRTSDKHLQLKIALACGLSIPNTLVTNSSNKLTQFYNETPKGVISKMQSSFAIYEDGKENVVFTNTLEPKHMEDLEGLQISPMKFQEKIEKQLELRVTVVGDEIFCFSIDSQAMDGAQTDWRKKGVALLDKWKSHSLPKPLEKQLIQLMDVLGLNYGAMDLILTPENKYVFLEVNPVGEFFWLDNLANGSISKAIANLLMGNGKRRIKNIPALELEER